MLDQAGRKAVTYRLPWNDLRFAVWCKGRISYTWLIGRRNPSSSMRP